MISPSSVQAVTRGSRAALALDRQRVVAHHGERIGQAGEHALALVMHGRGLAVHQLLGMHDLAAEGRADALVAEADAEQRDLAGELLDGATEMPASAGEHGPGEITMRSGFIAAISLSVIASLRNTFTSSPSSPKYCTRL
jgi:hypothetical protein